MIGLDCESLGMSSPPAPCPMAGLQLAMVLFDRFTLQWQLRPQQLKHLICKKFSPKRMLPAYLVCAPAPPPLPPCNQTPMWQSGCHAPTGWLCRCRQPQQPFNLPPAPNMRHNPPQKEGPPTFLGWLYRMLGARGYLKGLLRPPATAKPPSREGLGS